MKSEIPAGYFEKTSSRSIVEIRQAATNFEATEKRRYDIRSNGRHIWVEPASDRHEYWSPLLHLELEPDPENHTFIRGQFRKNPMQWLFFTGLRLISMAIFLFCAVVACLKSEKGANVSLELAGMSVMICLWLGMYFVSEWNRKRGAAQIAELRSFTEQLAA